MIYSVLSYYYSASPIQYVHQENLFTLKIPCQKKACYIIARSRIEAEEFVVSAVVEALPANESFLTTWDKQDPLVRVHFTTLVAGLSPEKEVEQ